MNSSRRKKTYSFLFPDPAERRLSTIRDPNQLPMLYSTPRPRSLKPNTNKKGRAITIPIPSITRIIVVTRFPLFSKNALKIFPIIFLLLFLFYLEEQALLFHTFLKSSGKKLLETLLCRKP